MGEIFSPGGSESLDAFMRRELSRRGRAFDQTTLNTGDETGFGSFPGTGALVSPLAKLATITIDPEWWALYGLRVGATTQSLALTFADLEGGITEQASAQYADTQIVGRAESFKSYIGTDNRQVNLRLQFRAQGLGGANGQDTLNNEVTRPARWLEGLKYPFTDHKGVSHAPPTVILALGELLVMRCVVDCTVTWLPPWDPVTHLPLAADVDVTFTAVHDNLGNYEYHGPTRFTGFQAPVG